MNVLKKMFGDDIPDPDSMYVTRWSLDKYTLGGPYAHPTKNGTMEDNNDKSKQIHSQDYGESMNTRYCITNRYNLTFREAV